MTIRLRTSTWKVIESDAQRCDKPRAAQQIFSRVVVREPCENKSALELCAIAAAEPAVKHLLYPESPNFPESLHRSIQRLAAWMLHAPVTNVFIDCL